MKRSLLILLPSLLVTLSCDDMRQPAQSMVPSLARTASPTLSFTNTPLLRPDGNSEPEIAIAANGTMGMVGLSLGLAPDGQFGTSLWTGPFGATPTFEGIFDAGLQQPGRIEFGGEDADVNFGSTGALHFTTLLFLGNQTLRTGQLGVSAITCPNAATAFSTATCRGEIIDLTESDRPWITSDGSRVFISYHDAGNSTIIHVQRSDDDGATWRRAGDPIVGQGSTTGQSTFNNDQGNLAADPVTHTVYDIYAAGEVGLLKAKTTDFDHIYVSRSIDGGISWTAALVFHAATPMGLNNVFPAVAVDPTNGTVHAAWSDGHAVSYATSSDHGVTWSAAVTVNLPPATTALFPWLAAHDGVVDLVYYGTAAPSKDDPAAVWNVYLAQATNGGAFQQSRVSNTPNHVGVICTAGTGCAPGTRNLLDLFQVALDPRSDKAAVIYTDDTIDQTGSGAPKPEVVLAQQQ